VKLRIQVPQCLAVLAMTWACNLAEAQDVTLEGGDGTVEGETADAFSHPLANLSDSGLLMLHDLGEQGFKRDFSRVRISGKILAGPKFNNVSCVGCHTGNGRGSPTFGLRTSQLVVKISSPRGSPSLPGGPGIVKGIGLQIHDHSIRPAKSDGRLQLLWQLSSGQYADGETFELRKPVVAKIGAATKLQSDTMSSIRLPPPVFGVGLLEAVPDSTLNQIADPTDSNNDGISGRMNIVWDISRKALRVGRFGRKAGAPTALQQIAGAYSTDMGVSNPLFRNAKLPSEINAAILGRTTFYVQTLGVPRARNQEDPDVISGKSLFFSLGCQACHTATLTTGPHAISEAANQIIHPFTDLLLHDMGEGLADNRPEFTATGSEWRTSPLWGIGLSELVMGNVESSYLHDGRARTLEEAILWHGGEGSQSRERFVQLSSAERYHLIQFLRSL